MNQAQALAKAMTLLGTKKVGVRVDNRALVGDDLAQMCIDANAAADERRAAEAARTARLNALLAADAEYQALKKAHAVAVERHETMRSQCHRRRIEIVRTGGMFTVVEAQGDNFEDAVAVLQRNRVAS